MIRPKFLSPIWSYHTILWTTLSKTASILKSRARSWNDKRATVISMLQQSTHNIFPTKLFPLYLTPLKKKNPYKIQTLVLTKYTTNSILCLYPKNHLDSFQGLLYSPQICVCCPLETNLHDTDIFISRNEHREHYFQYLGGGCMGKAKPGSCHSGSERCAITSHYTAIWRRSKHLWRSVRATNPKRECNLISNNKITMTEINR